MITIFTYISFTRHIFFIFTYGTFYIIIRLFWLNTCWFNRNWIRKRVYISLTFDLFFQFRNFSIIVSLWKFILINQFGKTTSRTTGKITSWIHIIIWNDTFLFLLNVCMTQWKVQDSDLIRLLLSRSEIDLPAIKTHYAKMYGKSLYDAVKSELSGDYEKLFLAIIGK